MCFHNYVSKIAFLDMCYSFIFGHNCLQQKGLRALAVINRLEFEATSVYPCEYT